MGKNTPSMQKMSIALQHFCVDGLQLIGRFNYHHCRHNQNQYTFLHHVVSSVNERCVSDGVVSTHLFLRSRTHGRPKKYKSVQCNLYKEPQTWSTDQRECAMQLVCTFVLFVQESLIKLVQVYTVQCNFCKMAPVKKSSTSLRTNIEKLWKRLLKKRQKYNFTRFIFLF